MRTPLASWPPHVLAAISKHHPHLKNLPKPTRVHLPGFAPVEAPNPPRTAKETADEIYCSAASCRFHLARLTALLPSPGESWWQTIFAAITRRVKRKGKVKIKTTRSVMVEGKSIEPNVEMDVTLPIARTLLLAQKAVVFDDFGQALSQAAAEAKLFPKPVITGGPLTMMH